MLAMTASLSLTSSPPTGAGGDGAVGVEVTRAQKNPAEAQDASANAMGLVWISQRELQLQSDQDLIYRETINGREGI